MYNLNRLVFIAIIFFAASATLAQPDKVYVDYSFKIYTSCNSSSAAQNQDFGSQSDYERFLKALNEKATNSPGVTIVGYFLITSSGAGPVVYRYQVTWADKRLKASSTHYWKTGKKCSGKIIYK